MYLERIPKSFECGGKTIKVKRTNFPLVSIESDCHKDEIYVSQNYIEKNDIQNVMIRFYKEVINIIFENMMVDIEDEKKSELLAEMLYQVMATSIFKNDNSTLKSDIPMYFYLFSRKIEIEFVSTFEHDICVMGEVHIEKNRIYLSTEERGDDDIHVIFWHEVAHLLFDKANLEKIADNEVIVHVFANYIRQFFKTSFFD